MAKVIITFNTLLKEGKHKLVTVLWLIFAIIGIGVSVNSLVSMINNTTADTIITFAVLTVFWGIPFGYFLGIRKVVYTLRKDHLIKNGDIMIFKDKIIDKSSTVHGRTSDMADNNCQLTLKYYSKKTQKNITVTMREFNSVKVGEQCFLFFTRLNKKPFQIFAGDKFELDSELTEKTVYDL